MALCFVEKLSGKLKKHGALVRVTVVEKKGSAPREVGTSMIVGVDHMSGTIGGGTLEYELIRRARQLLAETIASGQLWVREIRDYPLGPALGQCCGGSVKLLLEVFTNLEFKKLEPFPDSEKDTQSVIFRPVNSGGPLCLASPHDDFRNWPIPLSRVLGEILAGNRPNKPYFVAEPETGSGWFIEPRRSAIMPLYIYGAGHVGREIARVVEGLPFELSWIDFAKERFPEVIPKFAKIIATREPQKIAEKSERGAFHLVMTYSHPIDLAICHSVLKKDNFGYLGLIGSKTKRARFVKRLRQSGISQAVVSRMTCPIGIDIGGGKNPAIIAVSVAAQIVKELEQRLKNHNTPVQLAEMVLHE